MSAQPNMAELHAAFDAFSSLSGELTQAYKTLEWRVEQLQAELAEKRRFAAIGEVSARLAHQVRTPLSSAMLDLSQLAEDPADGERRTRLTRRALDSLGQIEHLVRDMLDFVRDQSGVDTRFRVAAMLDAFSETLAPQLRDPRQVEIRCECPDLWLEGQRDALVGALLNLAVNALQAGGRATRLKLAVAKESAQSILIEFSDDGPGIPAAIRDRVFEPFFTTRPGGNGLGLSFVRSTLAAHRGSIRLVEADEGTTFVLRLGSCKE